MRFSWDFLDYINWRVVGGVAAVVGLILAGTGLIITTIQISQVSHNQVETARVLETVGPLVEMTWVTANLEGGGGWAYVDDLQKTALAHQTTFLERDVVKGVILTPEGKMVLERAKIWEDVDALVRTSPSKPICDIILETGIPRLCRTAEEQDVTLETMIGLVAALAQETAGSLSE